MSKRFPLKNRFLAKSTQRPAAHVAFRSFTSHTHFKAPVFMTSLSHGSSRQAIRPTGLEKKPKLPDGPDPFNYTSGYWLHRDQLQRQARYINFDFSALCEKVLKLCPGAQSILRYEKREGGFNRVFIFHMDNEQRIVARIPFRVAGPQTLTTHSEVATMAYIRENSEIPVPRVLEWSDSKTNATGTEDIIMEHASGVQLHGKWTEMTAIEHMRCVRSLSKTIESMAALRFPSYGSIYFANFPIGSKLKIPLGKNFCVGPICTRDFPDCIPGEARYYTERAQNVGPWNSLRQYYTALLDQGFARIPNAAIAPKDEPLYHGSIQEHHQLLQSSEKVVRVLEETKMLQDIATPTLLHRDLHKRNLFVSEGDPTIITSVIDWQSTSIEPAFVYATETPDLVNRNSVPVSASAAAEASEDSPSEDVDQDLETAEARKALEKDEWPCYQIFELALKVNAPVLSSARNADQTLLRPLRYCGTSWRDGIAAARQEFIELSERWQEIGLPGECPYKPSAEELAKHTLQHDQFETKQAIIDLLIEMHHTNLDDWVHPKDWEAAKDLHQETFDWWLQDGKQVNESELNEKLVRQLERKEK